MTKHTPGPWVIDSDELPIGAYRLETFDPVAVYQRGGGVDAVDEEDEANAQLIEAAPEMYEALMEIVRHVHEEPVSEAHISEIARAALARARGEEVPL